MSGSTPSPAGTGHAGEEGMDAQRIVGAGEIAEQVARLPGCRVRRVTHYVQQNLDKGLTISDLAAVVYMSPYHFARLFKGSTGVPPHRFVARQRIASAVALLRTQEHSISEISHKVGFRTVSHFTTVFRRVTGTTPGAFRATALQDKRPGRGGSDDLP